MNIYTLLGALACLALTTAPGPQVLAQAAKQFSYISDRTFTSPDQLMGYDFKPAMREVPGEEAEEIPVGKYSFGVTRKNLYVEGPGIRGVYSVNNINTTNYGFILQTMNARDPTIQGHLKIVVDELGQVEGLIFKRSNNDNEVIFFLRVIPQKVDELEAEYFTNKAAHEVPHMDSLWTGVEVRPFLRVFNNMGGIQQRILPADSVYLNFYQVVTVEEREKGAMAALKMGKKRKRRRSRGADLEEAMSGITSEPLAMAGGGSANQAASDRANMMATLQAGEPVDTTQQPGVTAVEASDSTAAQALADLSSQAVDSLALGATPDSSAVVAIVPVAVDTAGVETKIKIITEYYVDLNSFMRYDDGSSEMQHRTFLINGIAERENTNSQPGGDRFQWELSLEKKQSAFVYLDENYNVNSIELDGQKFYMRGQ